MKTAALLSLFATLTAQQSSPRPAAEVTLRREIYKDARVTVFLLDIPPGQATVSHWHERDMLSVFVTGGKTRAVFNGGAPVDDAFAVGDVRFRQRGFTHSTENRDSADFLSVIFEFVEPQGDKVPLTRAATHTCAAEDPTACVDEKPLLCTAKVCVDEMTLTPHAIKKDASATLDRILVPVSGYSLSEQAEGTIARLHTRKTGEVEFIAAGSARRWTNTASAPARVVVVTFR